MMKHTLLYIAAAITGAAAFTACDNDFEVPPVSGKPFETVETNASLADIKTEYWSALSAPTTIGYDANGDTIIFKGRVCSSDKTGNIYKNIVIQSVDADGQQIAFTFSVNAYDIYEHFAYGQEVAVKATGLEVGGYRSLLQIGSISGSSMTFMDESKFLEHVVATAPFAYKDSVVITPATIADLNAAKANPQELMLWQSRLVKIENVSFVDAGKPCATSQTEDRYIVDEQGNRLDVRMSAYADFKENLLPYGTGSVTGIITTFDNNWQLTLIDFDGLEGFSNEGGEEPGPGAAVEPEGDGTFENPYNVARVLELINSGNITEDNVYVKGIVSSIREIDTASYGNASYYIKDQGGSDEFYIFRGYGLGNKKFTSADELETGADVVVLGQLINYMGNTPEMAQGNYIVSYNGQTSGNTGGETGEAKGDGTLESPYNVAKALQLITSGNFTEDKVYVTGFISNIGEIDTGTYGNASYYIKDADSPAEFYIFRGYALGNEKFTSSDQIATGAEVIVYGQLIKYGNTPEMAQGNYIVSYNGQTGGNTGGEEPDPGTTPDPGIPEGAIAASALTVPGTATVGGYTITIDQASGASTPVYNAGTSAVRLYAGNTISISGSQLTSVKFNLASDAGFRYTTVACSTGAISPAQAEGDTEFTWVGNATEVTFTVGEQATLGSDGESKKGQIRFTSLNIN